MSKFITTIIVDDQKSCIDTLKIDLNSYPDIKIVDTCTSVSKAEEAILNFHPSLLFLDIEMPKMSGLDFIRHIKDDIHWQMSVVFYSAFDKYVLDAFRNTAVDFLLKPYQKDELSKVIERVRKKQEENTTGFEQALHFLLEENRKVVLQTVSGLSFFKKEEMLYFEYTGNSWHVTMTNGTKHRLRIGTKSRDITKISSSFLQISPEYIINLNHVASIENKSLRCIFYPPFNEIASEIYISRRNYAKIKSLLDIL